MPNLIAIGLMVSEKKIFKDLQYFAFVTMASRFSERIKFFQEIMKRAMAGTFLRNFIKIGWVVSEKMFRIKVNALMNAQRTPGHDISLLAFC